MKTKTQFTKQILSIVLCLAMLAAYIPTFSLTAFAAGASTPRANGSEFFANGTDLFVDAGTSGGTAVYYYEGDTKVYLNENGAAGDDFDGYSSSIYAGGSTAITADVTITVLGGSIDTIYSAGLNGGNNINGNVTVKQLGGTIGRIYGRGGVDSAIVTGNTTLISLGGTVTNVWGMDGALYKSGTGWTLSGDAVIPSDMTITIAEGETFTISADSSIKNNGSIVNNGTIELYGPIVGNDVTGNGTLDFYAAYIENVSSVSSISAKINGTAVTLENGRYRLSGDNLYIWLPSGNAEVILNATKYYGNAVMGERVKLTTDYIPITDISGIPSQITAYVKTTLTPTTNATTFNPAFSYEIVSDGTTALGVELNDSVIYASSGGAVKLKVTASDGYFSYSEIFDIEVKDTGYTASIENGDITFEKYNDTQIKVTHTGFPNGYLIIDKDEYFAITGTANNTYDVTVNNGEVNIILNNCSISRKAYEKVPFSISSGASVNLVLTGNNEIVNDNTSWSGNYAGIRLPSGASLTIDGTGSLDVSGGSSSAGIGGGEEESAGKLIINGGTINATGGAYSAGIGGGNDGAGGTITINGGTVTATGGLWGAGIGGGDYGTGGTITINGGTVTATGGSRGAGIGGGRKAAGGTVVITGGNVKASSSAEAIGKGESGSSSGTLKDANGNTVSLNTITLDGVTEQVAVTAVEGIEGYGFTDVRTLDGGKLYLYLPSGESPTSITLENEDVYYGKVNGSSATFVKIDMSKKPAVDNDGFYLIADIDDLIWFSQYVVADNTINGRVTANIDTSGSEFTTIGTSDAPYAGTFDGGYHSITVDINTAENYAALFDYVNGATIQNLVVDGKITTSAKYASGLIGNSAGTTTVKNVISNVVIDSSVNGDGTHGGFVGVASGTLVMENCGFAGAINGTSTHSCGGFIGWANTNTSVTISNSYLAATFGVSANSGHTIARNYANASVMNITNFYYLNALNDTPASDGITQKTADQFASGEVTYLLNGSTSEGSLVWKQTIDTHAYPVFEGETVYCLNDTYSNTPHTHEWEYAVKETTITATCKNTDRGCVNTNGGSVTLTVKAHAYYTGSAIEATAEGSFVNGATYKLTYDDGSESAPSTLGKHKATLTVSENGTDKQSITAEYEISYLPVPSSAYTISGHSHKDGNTYWFKDGATITITALDGYTISKTLNSGYASSVTFSESESKVVYLKNNKGEMTAAITISETLSFDKTAPTGEIEITDRGFWEKLINKITFGLFFKGDKVATVTAADTDGSGVKSIEYYLADKDLIDDSTLTDVAAITKLEAAVDSNWIDYDNEIALNKHAKNVIYVKITDNVGNVTYINSAGIVLYTDAEAVTESVSTTYTAGVDVTVSVKLNGNTIKSVANGSTMLELSDAYTVDKDTITLKAKYLDTLNAGEYTFTVSYNPLGMDYVEATGNEAPATTSFKVQVVQAEGSVTNISEIDKTYDGKAVSNPPTYTSLSTGNATFKYKVKGADDSTYTATAPSAAGDYVVQVTVAADNNYKEAFGTAEFTIDRATITDVSAKQDGKLTYNGEAQVATVKKSATTVTDEKVIFIYSADGSSYGEIPKFTDAGTYTLYYIAYTTDNNYYDQKGSFTVTIDKQTVAEPTIASKSYIGSVQTADITDTDLYTVETNNGGTAKGSYDVVLELKDADNYKWSTTDEATVTVKFQITAAENEWKTAPSISGWTYGQVANEPSYAAKFGDVKVTYTGKANNGNDYNDVSAPTKAGNYTATFTVEGTEDYSGLEKSVDFTIAKATYDMTNAKWDYNGPFQYDDKKHEVKVIDLPEGVSVDSYRGNHEKKVGDYTASVSFKYDSNNYNKPVLADLSWSIKNDWTPAEYTVSTPNVNGWLNDQFEIKAAEGYKVSLGNTSESDWSDTLIFSAEGTGSITFYLASLETHAISLPVTVNYKLDKTPATGKVSFDERNGWEEFLNTITFGLFYKDEVTVKIDSTDALSGVASVEYYAADKAMTLDEVKVINEWTAYNGGLGVTVKDAKQFVYFVRITDNAGNVTYLSTDGAEYDTTVPDVSGVKDGETYYTTQVVTVTDKNLESITLNDEPVTLDNDTLTIQGNVDATYTIVARDKAGNITTVTVTMKEIVSVKEPIGDTTEKDVNSSDKETVQDVIDHVDELLKDEDLTEDEKKALEDIKTEAEKLIDKIEETDKADETEDIEKVKDITSDNVTTDDKEALEKAKEDLEKALEEYKDNYTDEEKKAIKDKIKGIDELLKVIENMEKATNAPKTGDYHNLWMLFALLFVSGMSILGITVSDKKRR